MDFRWVVNLMDSFRVKQVRIRHSVLMALFFLGAYSQVGAEVRFNVNALDLEDRENIDLERFSAAGFVLPGIYRMGVRINDRVLPEQEVLFFVPKESSKESVPCLTPKLVKQFEFKEEVNQKLVWSEGGQCLNLSELTWLEARGNLQKNTVQVSVPHIYQKYTVDNWDPPSSWDDGIGGIMLDYNLNGMYRRDLNSSSSTKSLSGNGVLGVNYDAWRFRAAWQASANESSYSGDIQRDSSFTRFYAYRPIPELGAKLTVGESSLGSMVFDSFNFTGASINSEDKMLPPNLRGYAPEIVGFAKTNAKVTVSEQGRVVYETTVPAGPFRIQELHSAISGALDVRIEEQDGSISEYQMNTANIPYLSRPGSVRYRLSIGQATEYVRENKGVTFAAGEYSWGVSNGLSLYGGAVVGDGYSSFALGLGRDLWSFGAVSFDTTHAIAKGVSQEDISGNSYKLSYSKRFDEYNSQVTFAGYRFSDKKFMNMNEYLNRLNEGDTRGNGKDMYRLMFNKTFDSGLSAYISFDRETYWDRETTNYYNLSVSDSFSIGNIKNASVNLSIYKNIRDNTENNGVYLSFSFPLGNGNSVDLNTNYANGSSTNTIGYYGRLDENSSYRVSAGNGENQTARGGAYYRHTGSIGDYSVNAGFQDSAYQSLGMSAQGGMTLTAEGGALHRLSTLGGARLLVDTGGVSNVPVLGNGKATFTNGLGNAVVSDVDSYSRSAVKVDLNKLPDNVEASGAVVQMTLTEGAIGYKKMDVIAGYKAMAVLKLDDGTSPPFGAQVMNKDKRQVAIVGEGGSVYLTGLNPGMQMMVNWGDSEQCSMIVPKDAEFGKGFNVNLNLECKMNNK